MTHGIHVSCVTRLTVCHQLEKNIVSRLINFNRIHELNLTLRAPNVASPLSDSALLRHGYRGCLQMLPCCPFHRCSVCIRRCISASFVMSLSFYHSVLLSSWLVF